MKDEVFEQEINYIGPGWQPIVRQAHTRIMSYFDPEHKVDQIKQKFGELRYYYHSEDENLSEYHKSGVEYIVRDMVWYCNHTCEECSRAGSLRSVGGYYTTLCWLHNFKAQKARRQSLRRRVKRLKLDKVKSK